MTARGWGDADGAAKNTVLSQLTLSPNKPLLVKGAAVARLFWRRQYAPFFNQVVCHSYLRNACSTPYLPVRVSSLLPSSPRAIAPWPPVRPKEPLNGSAPRRGT
eukprot:588673-Pyramimonas_sp.AAC.1